MWMLKMAWRDSRGSRRRLFLLISSMVIGIAALVAITSFGDNLQRAIDNEAEALFGADLSLEKNGPFDGEIEALIDSLGGEQSRRISFASMAYFPSTDLTRLSTIRAIEGEFPFYGQIETSPAGEHRAYLEGMNALVDASLLEQMGVQVGDSIKVGDQAYQIRATLEKTPRESGAVALFSPRVYIPLEGLDPALLQIGSRAEYEVYFKFNDDRDVEALVETLRPRLREKNVGSDTIREVQNDWNEGLSNLYRFLSLVGFLALLLGGIGVASAIHVYIKQRINTVAVLRCIGAGSRPTFGIYLIQASVFGFIAALIGSILGVSIQMLLPRLLSEYLPVDVNFTVSFSAILVGLLTGLGVTLLFALLPLSSIRKISPLQAIRTVVESDSNQGFDWIRWGIYLLLAVGIIGFAAVQAPTPLFGLGYSVGVVVVFLILFALARLVIYLARRFFPARWSYIWRQGFSNLFRPNNQTVVLLLSLGLGTFLIMTLYLVQQTLLNQINVAGGNERPNLILFDIQSNQLEGVSGIVEEQGLEVKEKVPIVTMRLKELKGRTVEEIRKDSTDRRTPSWVLRREYRSTYRDYITEAETLEGGEFIADWTGKAGAIPVTIEQDIAGDMQVDIGDSLVWDVQGVPMMTYVSGIRKVDWQRIQTNFFVVFPTGVLEEAPQFHVVLTKTENDRQAGTLQSKVVQAYPNISALDLSVILSIFDQVYSRIAFVLRFMALFSILTGLIVLIGAVISSRFQRIRESVLLKTLGASRVQVQQIMLVEYLFLGLLAAIAGLLLSLISSWLLAEFAFQTRFSFQAWPLFAAVLVVVGMTMLVGWLNSRRVYDKTPLEVLRNEV